MLFVCKHLSILITFDVHWVTACIAMVGCRNQYVYLMKGCQDVCENFAIEDAKMSVATVHYCCVSLMF